jgi:copper chaperone
MMTTNVKLSVPDISCGHCKSSIEGAVAPMEGVASAEVTIDDRTVDVAFDEAIVDLDAIIMAIEDQGYDVAR